MNTTTTGPLTWTIAALAVALLAFTGYGWTRYEALDGKLSRTTEELASTSDALLSVQDSLSLSMSENTALAEALEREREKNEEIEEEVRGIAKTVGTLEKLSKTDEELLQKYSKVYFLNEHYIPSSLSDIDEEYLYDPSRDLKIHSKVESELSEMIDDAAEDGINLRIVSAYRSFGTQAALKAGYTVTYGSGANAFSADQGYSEHQLGTTVDFTTEELGAAFNSFDTSEAYAWLNENAYRYGFALSYPPNNTYYQFEPWHWRFVGKKLARYLHREEEYFYDLDQRTINEYLIDIFD